MSDRNDIPETPFSNSPFGDEEGRPRIFVSGIWITPREVELEPPAPGEGCGCLIAAIIGFAVCVAVALSSGCTPRYTIIPADRECIPVKQIQAAPAVYQEAGDDATGWYVPDATMLELLEAD